MRKLFLILSIVFASLSATAADCEYPCKPVTFVMSVVAGGPADTLFARPFSEFFRKETGQPMIIEYMPSAQGLVQIRHLKASPGDGYTIGLVRSSTSVYKPVMDVIDYDPVKDLTNIAFFVRYPSAIYVNAESQYMSLKDLFDKAPPNGLNFGMSYHGARLLAHIMSTQEKKYIESIMYPGDGAANNALLGKQLDTVIGTLGGTPIQMQRLGKFRMIATTGDRRIPSIPNVPTLKELGYNIEQYTFLGVGGPPNMDPVVLKKINNLINKFVKDPEVQAKLNQDGMFTPVNNSSEMMSRFIDNDIKFWDSVRQKHKIPKTTD
jgi:tripartite-type tricarboxylate transporter receptor subunit TctC